MARVCSLDPPSMHICSTPKLNCCTATDASVRSIVAAALRLTVTIESRRSIRRDQTGLPAGSVARRSPVVLRIEVIVRVILSPVIFGPKSAPFSISEFRRVYLAYKRMPIRTGYSSAPHRAQYRFAQDLRYALVASRISIDLRDHSSGPDAG